jgi:hypothetical protein
MAINKAITLPGEIVRLAQGQRAVVLQVAAWQKIIDYLDDKNDLDQDLKIIRSHFTIQTGIEPE